MMYSMTIFASLLGSALGFSSIPDGMKIPCSTPVTVTVTVKDTWCQESHPHDFMENIGGDGPINGPFIPPDMTTGAHTSPTVVYTHGASTEPVWSEYADQGVADIATTGNNDAFLQRVSTASIASHWVAGPAASCGAVNPSPPQVSTGLVLNEQNTKISAIHMMAPSPDWFTGIMAVDMCVDGYWVATKTITAVPYDAGVDGGVYFRTADVAQALNTNKIAKVACDGAGGPFCNADNTDVNPVVEFSISTSTSV